MLIAYHWRRYWAKVMLEEMKTKKSKNSIIDFEKMSVLEMQIHMQQKRKEKALKEEKRKKKARAKK